MINIDKGYHFLAGLFVTLSTAWFDVRVALILLFVISLAKEVYDYNHLESHTADGSDFVATIVGGLFGAMLWVG